MNEPSKKILSSIFLALTVFLFNVLLYDYDVCSPINQVCPQDIITSGHPPLFDLDNCINCFCCAEICPQGAITPHRNLIAQLIGLGY